jgi:hypothetical protein
MQLPQHELDGSQERGLIPGWSELRGENMPIKRKLGVVDPEWRATQRRYLNDLAQRWGASEASLEAPLDHVAIEAASAIKQRLSSDDAQACHVRWSVRPLDGERALVNERKA